MITGEQKSKAAAVWDAFWSGGTKFADRLERIKQSRSCLATSAGSHDSLFASLQSRAFRGEL